MIIKDQKEIDALRESGKMCAYIRDGIKDYVKPGMSTYDADLYAGSLFHETGFISAPREIYSFPGNTCLSVNSCVAHGVPSKNVILKEGDSLNIDVCGSYKGYYTDSGVSMLIGSNEMRQQVCDCAKDMFFAGIKTIAPKTLLRDMAKEMQTVCKKGGFNPIKKLSGHGIGKTLHEQPKHIHCNYMRWDNRRFCENMVVAIETFVSSGDGSVFIGNDSWSWIAPGKSMTAQYEHTLIVTANGPIIVTE